MSHSPRLVTYVQAHVAQCFVPSGVRSFRLRLGDSDELDGEVSRGQSLSLEWSEEIDIKGWAQEIRHEMPSLEEVEVEVSRHVRAH